MIQGTAAARRELPSPDGPALRAETGDTLVMEAEGPAESHQIGQILAKLYDDEGRRLRSWPVC